MIHLPFTVKEYGVSARFIELAGQMNDLTQDYVIKKIGECLDEKNKSIKNSKILLLGLSYKPDVDDARESSSLKLYSTLMLENAMWITLILILKLFLKQETIILMQKISHSHQKT